MDENMRKALEEAWFAGWDAGDSYATGCEYSGAAAAAGMDGNAREDNPFSIPKSDYLIVNIIGDETFEMVFQGSEENMASWAQNNPNAFVMAVPA